MSPKLLLRALRKCEFLHGVYNFSGHERYMKDRSRVRRLANKFEDKLLCMINSKYIFTNASEKVQKNHMRKVLFHSPNESLYVGIDLSDALLGTGGKE